MAVAKPVRATTALSVLVMPPLSITLLIDATAVTPSPITSPVGPNIEYNTHVPSADTNKPLRYSLKPSPSIYLSINSLTSVYCKTIVIAAAASFLIVAIVLRNLSPKPIALPKPCNSPVIPSAASDPLIIAICVFHFSKKSSTFALTSSICSPILPKIPVPVSIPVIPPAPIPPAPETPLEPPEDVLRLLTIFSSSKPIVVLLSF